MSQNGQSILCSSIVTPSDYETLDVIMMFPACESRRCVSVSIVDDLVNEPEEVFGFTLERTRGLSPAITLDDLVAGEIVIVDDDSKMISIDVVLQCNSLLNWTPLGQMKVSLIVRCPHFRGC